MKMGRRIPQYALGLICMALGVVLLKRTDLGISPITALPAAAANITPLTLGNTTILLHFVCVIIKVILDRRITLKAVLTMCVGVPFGYLVDLLMLMINPGDLNVAMKIVFLLAGLVIQGLGVYTIVGCDLMLPAPDELNHCISDNFGKKMGSVKVVADTVYVCSAVVIAIIYLAAKGLLGGGSFWQIILRISNQSVVGIGTIASVLLTGRIINLFGRYVPQLRMEPLFSKK